MKNSFICEEFFLNNFLDGGEAALAAGLKKPPEALC